MRVIGTVGLPGSGKGEAAAVAREEGVPVVTMGDVIRRECRERGLDPGTDHGRVAAALREERGPAAIAELTLPAVESALSDADVVVVDGIRSDREVERFREAFGDAFSLVAIKAPFEVRRERIGARGRDAGEGDGGEPLAERDERERGFGLERAMAMADATVENTGSLAAFRDTVRTILGDGLEAVRA